MNDPVRKPMAELAGRLGETADTTVLWVFPPAQFAAWRAAGFGDLSYADYMARIEAVETEHRRRGLNCVRLEASVADVAACMTKHRLPNNPSGRAAAVSLLYVERMGETANGGDHGEAN